MIKFNIRMKSFLTKLLLLVSALSSAMVAAADYSPYIVTVGSSIIGTRENSKQDVHLGFNSILDSLLAADNIKCEFKDFDKTEYLTEAIKKNEINSMFGSPLEFIKSESYLTSAYLMSGVIGSNYKSKIIILVRKDSGIDTIEQLNGRKIAAQSGVIQDLGGLYLETLLLEKRLPESHKFFSETMKTETSNIALVSLFFKKVDMALMSESEFNIAAELNPQMRLQTKVIAASEPYLTFVAATSKNMPADKMDAIKKGLLNVEKTSKGKSILRLLKVDGFQVIGLNELASVRELIAKNKQLNALNNAK
jgi:ABC-type phosphate/phosphonate transport system substrate-binding protein